MSSNEAKPFLRWAGGKKWLIKILREIIDISAYETYHEPFLGGGSVFLALEPQKRVKLSDVNKELISTYKSIKHSPYKVFDALNQYMNEETEYYRIRALSLQKAVEKAARFIYLNQTSFNGLFRVNRDGKYNVPYGKRKNVSYDISNFVAVSKRLKRAELSSCDFKKNLSDVGPNDLVYLDPPYVVAKEGNGFIEYNQHLFSLEDQIRLSKCIDHIREVGAYYLLSNAKHETIYEIFNKGDYVFEVSRSSLIGGKNAYRGKTPEYLFTNIPVSDEKIILLGLIRVNQEKKEK